MQADDESVDEKADDNVRVMPRAEERIARAASKSAIKQQQLKEHTSKASSAEIGTEAPVKSRKTKKAEEEARTSKNLNKTSIAEDEEDNEYFETIVEARANETNPNNISAAAGGLQNGQILFSQLSLSRPLLRAVERTGYTSATPIQAQTIPYALAGKDICASAETGSGKTAGKYSLSFLTILFHELIFTHPFPCNITLTIIHIHTSYLPIYTQPSCCPFWSACYTAPVTWHPFECS